jgi:hypothetical protein
LTDSTGNYSNLPFFDIKYHFMSLWIMFVVSFEDSVPFLLLFKIFLKNTKIVFILWDQTHGLTHAKQVLSPLSLLNIYLYCLPKYCFFNLHFTLLSYWTSLCLSWLYRSWSKISGITLWYFMSPYLSEMSFL